MNEKIFTSEEKYNKQNDKLYAKSSKKNYLELLEKFNEIDENGVDPACVMVW